MSRLLCSASRFVREADKSKGEMCSQIMTFLFRASCVNIDKSKM